MIAAEGGVLGFSERTLHNKASMGPRRDRRGRGAASGIEMADVL